MEVTIEGVLAIQAGANPRIVAQKLQLPAAGPRAAQRRGGLTCHAASSAVHEEEHENHERWLVTYADMITLLMVLFIVLFAMSTVEEKKFNALKEGLAAGFGQSTSILDGSTSVLEETGVSGRRADQPERGRRDPEIPRSRRRRSPTAMREQNQQRYAEAAAEADRLAGDREADPRRAAGASTSRTTCRPSSTVAG